MHLSELGSHSAVKVGLRKLKVKTGEGRVSTASRRSGELTRLIAMAGVTTSGQAAGSWPMSNDEIQKWFSRDNIPLDELIQMWISMDQNDKTKTEILRLKDAGDIKELEKRLGQRIQFGTAGNSTTFHYLWRRSSRTHGSRLLAHERFDGNTSFSSSFY